MKTTGLIFLICVLALAGVALYFHAPHAQEHEIPFHGAAAQHGAATHEDAAAEEGPVTVSFAQNDDFYLCNDPFWLAVYEMMKETYAIGVENVTTELLKEKTFAFMRSWPGFTPEQAEGWVEHVKDIPAQFVAIIREDPTVLDNCENFSVAAVGPP